VLVRVVPEAGSSEKPWWRFLVDALLSWPVLIFLLIAYLLLSAQAPSRIEALFEPFQSLKLFGQEFVLNRTSGRNVEAVIGQFRARIQRKMDRQLKRHGIVQKRDEIMTGPLKALLDNLKPTQIRSTIYVPDVLFADSLYQLVDYYPPYPELARGRTFSGRYGIIGRAWRLMETQYAPSVSPDTHDLVNNWGMTVQEAERAAKGRQSFGCVVLKDALGNCLGIFYLDAHNEKAFGENHDSDSWIKIEEAIVAGSKETGLIDALGKIRSELATVSPRVDIYRNTHGDQ
jgi:hypothetical protein